MVIVWVEFKFSVSVLCWDEECCWFFFFFMSVFGVILVLLVSKIVWNLCEIEYGVIVVIVGKKMREVWVRLFIMLLFCCL